MNSKKGEVAGLREQLRSLQGQLAAIVAERAAHEDRVRILADKINMLNLQRQKEFQKWQVGGLAAADCLPGCGAGTLLPPGSVGDCICCEAEQKSGGVAVSLISMQLPQGSCASCGLACLPVLLQGMHTCMHAVLTFVVMWLTASPLLPPQVHLSDVEESLMRAQQEASGYRWGH